MVELESWADDCGGGAAGGGETVGGVVGGGGDETVGVVGETGDESVGGGQSLVDCGCADRHYNYQCCPHLFFNPSLTFFNGENNLKIIDQINNLNIAVTEEITVFNEDNIVDNIIIRDPGGLGYFLFSD